MTRRIEGLDPMPSPARIREMYKERTGRDVDDLGEAMKRIKLSPGSRVQLRIGELSLTNNGVTHVAVDHASVIVGTALHAIRNGRELWMRLGFPPRTKKTGATLGIRQKKAYALYRDAIIHVIEPVQAQLGLPLPPKPVTYNIAAIYYVDKRGELADVNGLNQGLHDALQDAGVIVNDWQFRTTDGTRIVTGDPEPRVELTITPIEP